MSPASPPPSPWPDLPPPAARAPAGGWPRLLYLAALLAGVAPLWAGGWRDGALPMVDLPQHLHLISVLHRLDDPSTLYPQVFAERGTLTPYLGYYYAVSALGW